jgi:hypothetical protein
MLTRKYYKMIAKVIKDNTAQSNNNGTLIRFADSKLYKHSLIDDLCIEFKSDNHLFNRDRFVDACNDE